jgi:hypothetical protein
VLVKEKVEVWFAASFCSFKNCPFPGLLRSSSPSDSLRIPILPVFQCIYPASSDYDLSSAIFSLTFSPAASHSSVWLLSLGHLKPNALRKKKLKNVRNLFVIWVVSVGRRSSVGIAIRYGLHSPGTESRWGDIIRTCPDWPWGPPSLLYKGYRVFPGGKTAGPWPWPPTPSNAEVKERVYYNSTLNLDLRGLLQGEVYPLTFG